MKLKDTDLHVYLEQGPDTETFADLLSLYGFEYLKTMKSVNSEPVTDYFSWKKAPISGNGFRLLFFHTLFSDDLNVGKYESFVILSGDQESSIPDFNMIDTIALLLIERYGGRLHNPQRIDKISTSFLLCGTSFDGSQKK